jgi:phosphate transport system ATP-binding protein
MNDGAPCCPTPDSTATNIGCCPTPAPMMTASATCSNGSCPGLSTQALGVSYHNLVAVRDVSLEAPSCAITALVGPSGCGKSTVLACLNRLIDLVPGAKVSGRVLLGDRDVRAPGLSVAALRTQVGMIFQRPTPFPLSIRRNLALPLKEHGVSGRDAIASESERCLRAVGLWDEVKDRLDTSALNLSGGQQQRLCLARALVLKPQVLLLDEPCSALDPISAGVVEDLIVSLRGAYTVVVVTHDLAQARRIADRVAVFWNHGDGGRIIAQGPAAQVFSDPGDAVAAAYLAGRRA